METKNDKVRILQNGLPGDPAIAKFLEEHQDVIWDARGITSLGKGTAGSLPEYDIIILNLQNAISIPERRIAELKKFLNDKHGILVYVLHPLQYLNEGGETISNYRMLEKLLPISDLTDNSFPAESVASYVLSVTELGRNSPFSDYLQDETVESSVLISPKKALLPLSVNVEKYIAAFTFSSFQHQVFAVPPVRESFVEKLLACAFESLKQMGQKPTRAPGWVYDYYLPDMEKIKNKITDSEKSIQKFEKNKTKLHEELAYLENTRNVLLSENGLILETTILDVLSKLGLNAKIGPAGKHDIEFIHKGTQFVVEIKGKSKGLDNDNLRQLVQWVTDFELDNDNIVPKGILIINPFRKISITKRIDKVDDCFPKNLKQFSERHDLCIITTFQLYVIYAEWRKDSKNLDLDKIITEWKNQTWIRENVFDHEQFQKTIENTKK